MSRINAASEDATKIVAKTSAPASGRWPAKTNPPANIHGLGCTCQSSAGNENEVFVEKNKLKTTCALCNREIEIGPEQFFLFFCCTRCGCDFWPPDSELRRLYRNYKGEVAKKTEIERELRVSGDLLTFPEHMKKPSGPVDAIARFCRYVCKKNSWAKVDRCANTNCPLYKYRSEKVRPKRKVTDEHKQELTKRLKGGPDSRKSSIEPLSSGAGMSKRGKQHVYLPESRNTASQPHSTG